MSTDGNEKYTNKYHPDFVPGTINFMLDKIDADNLENMDKQSSLKVTKDGIVLHPQPSDSPNDPLNWSRWTKILQFGLLLFITGFTAATSNDAGSVQDSMNEIYDISYDSMNTGAGVLFISIGLSTYFLGPTSSLYGRKLTYFICIVVGLIGAIWFGYAKRTSDTIWSQLFVGASEGCAEATVQLSISDMYFAHQLSTNLTMYILATSVGTYLGPLIAGFIVQYAGFRWVGWIAAIISGVLIVIMVLTQYETAFDRTKYYGKIDSSSIGNESAEGSTADKKLLDEEKSKGQKVSAHAELASSSSLNSTGNGDSEAAKGMYGTGANESRISFWKRVRLITPSPNLRGTGFKQYFNLLFLMLRVFWFPPVLLSGILWGLQDAFLTFYLTTEDDLYYYPPWNYSDTGVALMNVPCAIGAFIGCLYAGWFSDQVVFRLAKRRGGIHEAEDYLWMLITILIVDPIGLMIFAVGTDRQWSWKITYTIGLGFIGFSFGCAGDIAMSYLMSSYPEMILEGMIGVSLINNGIGCIFTFTCSPWLDVMSNTKTYAILSGLQVGACLMIIPFMKYGKSMRLWTKKYYISYIEARDGVSSGNALSS
ncbi:DEKNAAC101185 [Brettanomyces naardenensis]|uniref:DEKNAAC101185 n=1 Tax=Brettanomyces naardenensis TaxID=13370 RepID=A0A448YH45_BRENA|nr:DEKNAAC101185 [Brettanomyces naardenensis]